MSRYCEVLNFCDLNSIAISDNDWKSQSLEYKQKKAELELVVGVQLYCTQVSGRDCRTQDLLGVPKAPCRHVCANDSPVVANDLRCIVFFVLGGRSRPNH